MRKLAEPRVAIVPYHTVIQCSCQRGPCQEPRSTAAGIAAFWAVSLWGCVPLHHRTQDGVLEITAL